MEELSGQEVEQFGRSATLVSSLYPHLSFLDHVHEFNPDECALGCLKRLESEHGTRDPFDCSMVLFYDIIQVFHLPDGDVRAVLFVIALDGGFIRVTAVNRDGVRDLSFPKTQTCYHA